MQTRTAFFLALLAGVMNAHAGPRTSSSYTVRAKAADAGGQRVSNPLVPFLHRPKQAGEPVRA